MQLLKFVSRIQKFANLVHTDKYKKVLIPLDLFLLSAIIYIYAKLVSESSAGLDGIKIAGIVIYVLFMIINLILMMKYVIHSAWIFLKVSFTSSVITVVMTGIVLLNNGIEDMLLIYLVLSLSFVVCWSFFSLLPHNRIGIYVNAVLAMVISILQTISNTAFSMIPDIYFIPEFSEAGLYERFGTTGAILTNFSNLILTPLFVANASATIICLIKGYYIDIANKGADTLDSLKNKPDSE